jgi:hypothetical protein
VAAPKRRKTKLLIESCLEGVVECGSFNKSFELVLVSELMGMQRSAFL